MLAALIVIFLSSAHAFRTQLKQSKAVYELLPEGTEDTEYDLEKVKRALDIIREKPPIFHRQGTMEMQKMVDRVRFLGPPLRHFDNLAIRNRKLEDYLFEGDILLNVEQAEALAGISHEEFRTKRQYKGGASLWNNKSPIYYTLVNMMRVFTEKNIWSSQDISIGVGCHKVTNINENILFVISNDNIIHFYMGTVTHEIAHALGFYHTQGRPDRDTYVQINFPNIKPQATGNFIKVNDLFQTTSIGGYDFGSVMQYSPYSFAVDVRVPTVLARDWRFQSTMGQRDEPSFGDVRAMNIAYRCNEFCASQLTCFYGGVMDSRNCSQCKCAPQFEGERCQNMRRGSLPVCNAQILQAEKKWKAFRGEFGYGTALTKGEQWDCNWHIQAPVGQRVYVRITELSSRYCYVGCYTQAIEVTVKDFHLAGMRFCCRLGTLNFSSTGNLITIRGLSRRDSATFNIHYIVL